MNRQMVLGVLVAIGAVSVAAAYQAQPAAPKVIEVEKLKDNLYLLKNGGGNTAVLVGASGVVVVDTKYPGWGQPILEQIKGITDKPVTTIINTHTHGDHVSGNVEFPATVDVVVQENTKTNMEKMVPPTGPAGTNIFKENGGRGLPKRTFKDKMTIGKGADEVDLYYFGRGHTNGDAWVVFRALLGQESSAPRHEQRRQRGRDRQHAAEGARRDQERRFGDHRTQHGHAVGRSGPVRAVQQGFSRGRPGRGHGREDAG
jgi:hypothetical protein